MQAVIEEWIRDKSYGYLMDCNQLCMVDPYRPRSTLPEMRIGPGQGETLRHAYLIDVTRGESLAKA